MGQSRPTRHQHNAGTMSEQHHIAEPMLRQRLYTIVLSPAPYLHTDRLPIPGRASGRYCMQPICRSYYSLWVSEALPGRCPLMQVKCLQLPSQAAAL